MAKVLLIQLEWHRGSMAILKPMLFGVLKVETPLRRTWSTLAQTWYAPKRHDAWLEPRLLRAAAH